MREKVKLSTGYAKQSINLLEGNFSSIDANA